MTKTDLGVALVIGASTGIGRATANALRQAGFRVFGTSHREGAKDNLVSWRDWLDQMSVRGIATDCGRRFDRSLMSISAAVDGVGVALESRLLVQREVETGRLVLPFGMTGPSLVCHHLLLLRSKAHIPKIKAFREWLATELARTVM